jgi:hypothetical protein
MRPWTNCRRRWQPAMPILLTCISMELRWCSGEGMLGANGSLVKKSYTQKQGQYLAFIYYYTKLHGRAPAEADFQAYFWVTPPSVHTMILTLAANGLIERVPAQPRSIRLLLPREELPDLE